MAKIATCPQCAAQLGLPATASDADQLECPECKAAFTLGETIQIALPIAKVAEPLEAPAVPEKPIQVDFAEPSLVDPQPLVESELAELEPNEKPPAPASWEARLKKALAADKEELTPDLAANPTPSVEPESASPPSPSFEFQLDRETPAEPAPQDTGVNLELPQTYSPAEALQDVPTIEAPNYAPPKTLADFASQSQPPASGLSVDEEEKDEERTVGAFEGLDTVVIERAVEPAPVAADPAPEPTTTLPPEVDEWNEPESYQPRRIAGRGFPKMAALLVGPVAGSLLGLYGLLWIQGKQADYVGLSHVLPQPMLPAEFAADTSLAEKTSAEEGSSLATARELMSQPVPPMKNDEAVQPATAYEPVRPARSSSSVTFQEFHALVDAATTASPNLLSGDFNEPASVRSKGQAYMALCRLAEQFDFAQQPALAPTAQADVRKAKQLYQEIADLASARQQLAHIASRWWDYDQRPSQGIFLMGTVVALKPTVSGTICEVKLKESGVIPVLLTHQRHHVGDAIGVVGKIVGKSPVGLTDVDFTGEKIIATSYTFVWNPQP